MKKMSFKCIFNWLYAKTLDRAMTERQPREDREPISPVYRPVCVSYVSRTMLVSLFLLVLGGWNTQAWGECTLISDGSGSKNTKYANETVYTCSFTNSDNDAATISYTCTIGTKVTAFGITTDYGSNVKVQGYYNNKWNDIATLAYGRNNQNQARSHTLTGDAMKLTQVRFVTTDKTTFKYDYSVSNFKVVRASSLKLSQSSHDLGNVNIDATSYKDFTVTTYNLSGTASTSISGDGAFSRTLTANSGDCPKTWTLRVSYNPTCSNTSVLEQKKCTVTVSLGGKTASVIVKATPQLVSQSVSWVEGRTTTIVAGESMNIEGYATSTSTIDGKRAIYYTSSAPDVISVGADGHTLTAKGTAKQSAIITAHQDDDCKFASATATQTFTITKKLEPNIVLKVDGKVSDLTTLNLKVGDKVYVELENVSDGLDGDFTAAMTKSEVVSVTRLGNTLTIEALKEDATTVTLKQTANSTIAGASKTYTINVTRIENTLALNKSADTKYIDQEVTDVLKDASINSNAAIKTISSDATIAYYDVEADKIVIKNSDKKSFTSETITIKIWQEQNVKYAASDEKIFTLTVNKYPTSFTGSAYNLMVDGTQTADYGYTNTSAEQPTANSSDDFYYTIDEVTFANEALNNGTNLVTFNPSDKKITACNAGTAKITMHQKETYKYTGATASYNVAVYKYNSVFDKVEDLSVKVDKNVSSAYTLTYTKPNAAYVGADNHTAGTPGLNEASGDFYYTLAQSVTTNITAGSPDASLAITYDAASKNATGKNAGKGTVHLYQKETYKYNAEDASFDVNVTKYANSISCSWGSWTKNLNFNQETNVVFSANNKDVPIVVTQKTGKTIATYHSAPQNTIRASYSVGEATWSVSQAENYKYLAPETKTVTVNVNTVASECYVLDEPAEKSIGKYGDAEHKQYQTYSWSEEGAVLKFKMWKYSDWNDVGNYVTLYDGAGVKIGNDYSYSIGSMKTSPYEYTITLPAGVRSVRFRNGTGAWEGAGTLNTYISNVLVTRKEWFEIEDKDGNSISSLSMPTLRVNNTSTSATFYVDYSTCADVIKLVSNNSHITFFDTGSTTYQFNSDGSGRKEIILTYTNASIGDVSAVVTVYTPYENKTLSISAQTDRNNQEIVWATGYEGATVSLPVGLVTSSAATATSELPVIYSVRSEDADVISIRDDGASFEIIGTGTAQLTATQAGNKDYNPTSSTKIINATDKKIQVIQWGQNFTRALALSEVHTLQADVYLRDIVTATSTYSAARSELLTYTCPNGNGVISVSGNKMTILAYGQTTVTAHVAGSEDYEEAAPVTLIVKVLEPSAGCETPLVLNKESLQLFSMDIDWGEWTTPQITSDPILIDRTIGKPDKLSFQHEGEEYPIPYFSNIKVYRGAIKVQQRVNGSWSDVEGSQIEPTKYVWNQLSDLQLNEDADAIRFVRLVKGQGYHNIKDIQVTLLQYLRTNEPLVDFGNVPAGAVLETTLGFEYSDVKGNLNAMVGAAEPIFTVEENPVEMVCGAAGHYDLPVRFAPKAIGTWENSVTVLDPITKKTVTINVKANVTKGSQSISWNPVLNLYANETVALNATATSGLEVSYNITEGSDVAEIRNGVVVILQPGTFTITASQSGTRDFNPAEPVVKTFTVSPIVLTLTAPTASSITAAQTLNKSALTGGSAVDSKGNEVAGTWAWQNSSATYSAGEYTPTVVFTPSTNPAWYSNTTTTTALTVTGVEYIFTNGHGDSDWNTIGNWLAGTKPGNNEDVIIRGNLIINNNVEVHSLTIEGTGSVTMVENGTLTINGTSKYAENYGNLYVQNGGEVDVVGTLKVRDLIVEASIGTSDGTAESGQVVEAEHITYANAYIEIHMDPADVMDDTKWYGFTVPFAVNAHTGVSRKEGGTYRNCTYGSHYMIAEYDAAKRLTSGKGWKYLSGNTLNPGQFYFFTVNGNYNTYRFKASEASYTPAAAASLAMNGGVENANANWNGVGNSTLRHATVSYTGGSYVQVYENGLDAYKTVATSEAKFVVGCPFFIQATEASTLVLDVQPGESERYYAPRRTSANQTGVARVNLTSVDGGFSDQIYVSATDREQDCYLAGHDLSKAGESKIVPQLWIDAYNQKLSVHELAWQGNEAYCAISLYAPQAGEYVLAAKQPTDGTEVYLTYNGQVLWNLTSSEYVLSLEKGTTTAYGLQIVKAPAITTGVDQIDVKGQTMRKVLMNDKIFIITPEGAMYDVLGKGVKF